MSRWVGGALNTKLTEQTSTSKLIFWKNKQIRIVESIVVIYHYTLE